MTQYDKKKNVVGSNGPRRHELPTFADIGVEVPDEVMQELLDLVNNDTRNDLDRKAFLNQNENFVGYLGERYRQIYLQEPSSEGCGEEGYTVWNGLTPKTQKYMESIFGNICRARISITPTDFASHWHIDTDTSVLCRAQLIVQSDGCGLEFNRRNEESFCDFKPGKIYFINVGWMHRLINPHKELPKISIVFGIHYKNIEQYVKTIE